MCVTENKHAVHTEPVWRDRSNFIINAPLEEPGRLEQLWCRQVSSNTFEVCCIPFFLYDVALGDIVETKAVAERRYVMNRVIQTSGRYVFRVHFERSAWGRRRGVFDRLEQTGALLEWSSSSLLAADARDALHGQMIADYLVAEQRDGRLIYETGRSE